MEWSCLIGGAVEWAQEDEVSAYDMISLGRTHGARGHLKGAAGKGRNQPYRTKPEEPYSGYRLIGEERDENKVA